MKELYELLTDLDFWIHLLEQFKNLGLIAPFFLAFIESLIPALPLIAIVSLNVGVHGPILGFLTSWTGTMCGSFLVFYFSRMVLKKWLSQYYMKKPIFQKLAYWISDSSSMDLFLLTCVAFTPSSLINISYGLSDFPSMKFYKTLLISKFFMILVLALFGHTIANALQQPIYLIGACLILVGLLYVSSLIKKKTKFSEIEKD